MAFSHIFANWSPILIEICFSMLRIELCNFFSMARLTLSSNLEVSKIFYMSMLIEIFCLLLPC